MAYILNLENNKDLDRIGRELQEYADNHEKIPTTINALHIQNVASLELLEKILKLIPSEHFNCIKFDKNILTQFRPSQLRKLETQFPRSIKYFILLNVGVYLYLNDFMDNFCPSASFIDYQKVLIEKLNSNFLGISKSLTILLNQIHRHYSVDDQEDITWIIDGLLKSICDPLDISSPSKYKFRTDLQSDCAVKMIDDFKDRCQKKLNIYSTFALPTIIKALTSMVIVTTLFITVAASIALIIGFCLSAAATPAALLGLYFIAMQTGNMATIVTTTVCGLIGFGTGIATMPKFFKKSDTEKALDAFVLILKKEFSVSASLLFNQKDKSASHWLEVNYASESVLPDIPEIFKITEISEAATVNSQL